MQKGATIQSSISAVAETKAPLLTRRRPFLKNVQKLSITMILQSLLLLYIYRNIHILIIKLTMIFVRARIKFQFHFLFPISLPNLHSFPNFIFQITLI